MRAAIHRPPWSDTVLFQKNNRFFRFPLLNIGCVALFSGIRGIVMLSAFYCSPISCPSFSTSSIVLRSLFLCLSQFNNTSRLPLVVWFHPIPIFLWFRYLSYVVLFPLLMSASLCYLYSSGIPWCHSFHSFLCFLLFYNLVSLVPAGFHHLSGFSVYFRFSVSSGSQSFSGFSIHLSFSGFLCFRLFLWHLCLY
jgi:hypothetical protein